MLVECPEKTAKISLATQPLVFPHLNQIHKFHTVDPSVPKTWTYCICNNASLSTKHKYCLYKDIRDY